MIGGNHGTDIRNGLDRPAWVVIFPCLFDNIGVVDLAHFANVKRIGGVWKGLA